MGVVINIIYKFTVEKEYEADREWTKYVRHIKTVKYSVGSCGKK